MSTWLVTGAAGFIGSHTVEAAASRGHTVRAVDSFADYYAADLKTRNTAEVLRNSGVRVLHANLNEFDLDKLLDGVDVVIHLAGQPGVRSSWSDFDSYLLVNISATERLLAASLRSGVSRFVYASSSFVSGNAKQYPVSETDPVRPSSPYGVTKLAAELLVQAYAENFGLGAVSLWYFTVYGPRQRPDMAIQRLILAALEGLPFELFGNGRQVRDFTYVGDVVAANIAAGESVDAPAGTICNIAGGSAVNMLEVVSAVEQVTQTEIELVRRDRAVGDVVETGGSTAKAAEILGWNPVSSLLEGVAEQVESVRNCLR